jgi:uncharacterized protein YcbK (DUF882 family)
MGDLSKNISRYEIACKCGCGFDSIDSENVQVVQAVCDGFALLLGVDRVVLHISSGARCRKWNRTPVSRGGPGSNDRSQHVKGRAIDFKISGVKPSDVYAALVAACPDWYGIGSYKDFTHLDTRGGPAARWGEG